MKIKGMVMIRKGNENQPPAVVYVSHYNPTYEWWVTPELNTPKLLFSKESELLKFDYIQFQIMYFEWKIANQPIVTKRLEDLLLEYKK